MEKTQEAVPGHLLCLVTSCFSSCDSCSIRWVGFRWTNPRNRGFCKLLEVYLVILVVKPYLSEAKASLVDDVLMGKQGSPRSPRPEFQNDNLSLGMKDYQKRVGSGNDPPSWRRITGNECRWNSKSLLLHGLKSDSSKYSSCRGLYVGKKDLWLQKHIKTIVVMFGLMGFLFLLDSLMVSFFDSANFGNTAAYDNSTQFRDRDSSIERTQPPIQMYDRLLNLASSALAEKEFKQESSNLWAEPYRQKSSWEPCADRKIPSSQGKSEKSNGYILVSANGGLNQQRVAICNAVAVASLLNATLVIPKFLYSNVWNDPSQFGDIYQEDYFIDTLKDDINIVKDLPPHLKSLDIEAIGSQITDADLVKEATAVDYTKIVLPLLLQNGVVHFLGYGNRLGFDPLPSDIQKLRCKCNFHALKFAPKIQELGALLVKRIRKHSAERGMLDTQLLGKFIQNKEDHEAAKGSYKYLALHLRFEVDMVAYSLCEFGGRENERKELQIYRGTHFPLLLERLKKSSSPISPMELRKLGRCPLTPEEAGLVLAGVGFKSETYIYLAGSHIYGGKSRMHPFTRLYPNLVTKEDLLTPSELAPFRNFSSQLAALDFIACATADVFAMTDSGSQLSSLVSGFRTYYGGGHAPTLRPNKKRLAAILSENDTIGWNSFEDRIKKMIQEGQKAVIRKSGRSIYRQPRCPECMCRHQ